MSTTTPTIITIEMTKTSKSKLEHVNNTSSAKLSKSKSVTGLNHMDVEKVKTERASHKRQSTEKTWDDQREIDMSTHVLP